MGLKDDIGATLNAYSAENGSDTPDFILADYLLGCLAVFDATTKLRDKWWGHKHDFVAPGGKERDDT